MKFAIGTMLLALAAANCPRALGQDLNHWTDGGSNDLWTNPSNWSLGIVPVNSTTNPYTAWDDPSSPFYPLTPDTSDDYPLGNNDAYLSAEGSRALIDSSVDAKAFGLRVGFNGASNTLEITGGHLQVGGILLPEVTEQVGHFLDIGRGYNMTSNPNPVARVQMSGGTVDANWLLIPEQFIDPSKADPYDTAPLNGELIMTGGTINTYFINLGQLVGNGSAELSGDAVINIIKRPDTGFGSAGFLWFNRNWYDSAGQEIDSFGEVNLDVSDNAVINIFGNSGEGLSVPDESEVARYESYVDLGWLTANGGTAEPVITLETIDGVPRIIVRPPQNAILGDYNDDGSVNAADYTVWRDNLGASIVLENEDPDALTPGLVDQEDFVFWKVNFGNNGSGTSLATSGHVPEPNAIYLILTCAGAICWKARPRLIAAAITGRCITA